MAWALRLSDATDHFKQKRRCSGVGDFTQPAFRPQNNASLRKAGVGKIADTPKLDEAGSPLRQPLDEKK